MNTDTTIAQTIRAADKRAGYDAACKRLLSEKIILAWIMKSCAEEYRDCDVNEIAEEYIEGNPQIGETVVAPDGTNQPSRICGAGKEDATLTEGTVTYDIRFLAAAPVSGERIRLIVNVEAQNDYYPGYPLIKRGIYYCSRMISAQYGTEFSEAQYGDIKKVYSIWLCMRPPKSRENSITRYYMTEENLAGHVREKKAHYDLMTVVMICLGESEENADRDILKLLNVLLSTKTDSDKKCEILENDFGIKMTQALESEVSLMCNLSKGVEEQGRIEGRAEGRAEGRIEGKAEGRIEGRIEGIHAMIGTLKKLQISPEIILREICEQFGLTKEEAGKYLG